MLKLLTNPWVLIGALVAFAIYTAVIVRSAYNEGKSDCEFRYQGAIIAEQARIDAANAKLAKDDAEAAVINEVQENELEAKIEKIPPDASACLSADAADRLRGL